MATYSRVKTFVANETLTASDLNTEFNNIITNTNSGNLNSDNVSTSAAWTWTGYHTYSTSSRIVLADNIFMTLGNATDGDYRLRYNSSNTALELTSTNSDGSGTDAVVMDVQDGTDDVRIRGGLSTNNNAAPTSGIVTGGNIVSDTDSTDDLGTTSVRWANLYVDAATITNNLTVGGTLTLTGGLTLNGNVTVGDNASDTLTINSTITSNLIFTDNTYDIGASGATRPRDLHLSRNALMGGTLGVTGLLTATAGVTSGSNIVSDTDSTDDLGTTSVRWANLYVDSIGDNLQTLSIASLALSFNAASEINTSGNNALTITTGSANLNVTAGTLALTGAQTISGNLTVDTSTLVVDSSNNRVGIGHTAPDVLLHASAGGSDTSSLAGDTQAIFANTAASDSISRVAIIAGATTGFSVLDFGDTAASNVGNITYSHQNNTMEFATTNGTAKMHLSSDGELGVLTTSPRGLIDIAAASRNAAGDISDVDDYALVIRCSSTTNEGNGIAFANDDASVVGGAIIHQDKGSANTGDLVFYTRDTGGNVDEAMRIDNAQQLLVGYTSSQGSYKLQVNSQIFATNATVATSDGRYKEDVQTLSNASDLVSRLNPVQFKWKSHSTHSLNAGKTDVGFIAQEVQEVLSDTDYSDSVVVSNKTDDEEYLGLGETKLIPLLTAAIQELTQRVKELESN